MTQQIAAIDIPSKSPNRQWLALAALFLISFTVYLSSLPPWFILDDNPEFIAGAYGLGVIHPPGYPLFLMLARLCMWIPLPNPAFAANFASALLGALAVAAFFNLVRKTGVSFWGAIFGSCVLAFSRLFWSESLEAEVYIANVLLCFLGLIVYLKAKEHFNVRWSSAYFFLFALAIINHYSSALIFIPAGVGLVAHILFRAKKPQALWTGLFLFCASAVLWLYLPLRSAAEPAINWTALETFEAALNHIKGINLGGALNWADKGLLLGAFARQGLLQFAPGLLILLIPAVLFLKFGKSKMPPILWVTLVGSTIFGVILPIHYVYSDRAIYVLSYFYIPAFSMLALGLAFGADWAFRAAPSGMRPVVMAALLGWSFSQAVIHWGPVNQNQNRFAWDYANSLMSIPEKGARVLLPGETEMFPAVCLQETFGLRPDLVLYGIHGRESERFLPQPVKDGKQPQTQSGAGLSSILAALIKDADNIPTYSSIAVPASLTNAVRFVPTGLLYKISTTTEVDHSNFWDEFIEPFDQFSPKQGATLDYLTRNTAAGVLLKKADWHISVNKAESAANDLSRLLAFAPKSRRFQTQAGDRYFRIGKMDAAFKAYSKALNLTPDNLKSGLDQVSLHNNMAAILAARGELDLAIEQGREAAKLAPNMAAVHLNLATLHFNAKHYKMASERYEKAFDFGLESAEMHNKMAISLEKTGRFPEAHYQYQAALKLDPNYAPTYKDFGIFMALQQNNRKMAVELWKRYLKLAPDAPDKEDMIFEIQRYEKLMGEERAPNISLP